MTRTFSRYAVSIVLVAVAAIALWGIGSAMYAQQGGARNEHTDTSALAQDPATKLPESDPYAVPSPSPEDLSQRLHKGGTSLYQSNNRIYYLKNQKASTVVESLRKMYPHLHFIADERTNGVLLVGGSSAMHARLNEFLKYSDLSPEEKKKRGLPQSIREFIQSEAPEMLTGEAASAGLIRPSTSDASSPALEQQVRQEFDARQASLRQQIKDFSQRLDKLRVLVDERDRAKDAIIQRRVDELRNPNLRWEAADQADAGGSGPQGPTANVKAVSERQTSVFRIRHAKTETLLKTISTLFGNTQSGIQLSSDPATNSILVNAAPSDMQAIAALLIKLDVPPRPADAASQATELDGLWEINYPQEIADKTAIESRTRVVFYKNLYGTFTGNILRTAGTFSNLQGTSPKRLAIYGDTPMRGIYEVKDDGLRLNMAPIDAAFPTAFGTEKPEFKRINKAVPQELLDRITSDLQDRKFNTFAGNRLSESADVAVGGGLKITPERDVEKAILKALLDKIDANFEECPLNEVLDSIASKAKVNVVIDEVALRDEGVDSNHLVTFHSKEPISLNSLLDQILSPLRLTYVVENDVLKITSKKGAGSSGSVQPDAAVELPNPDPIAALWQQSPNDFHSDVAWAQGNVRRTRKAMDRQLAGLKKTKPEATDADVEQADKAIWNAWNTAKVQHDLLFEELAREFARVESSWTACRALLADERANLVSLEHGVASQGALLEQRNLVESLRVREQQLATLRNLYHTLNDQGRSDHFPLAPQPGSAEIEDDLRKVGIEGRPTTFKPSDGEDERKGLLVTAIHADSPAAKAGLQANDVIVAAHIWEMASLDNLWYALSCVRSPRDDKTLFDIKVWVWRNGQYISVHLQPLPLKT